MTENIISTDRQTDRQTYLDIAKGIGIILVVIGHCVPDASSPAGISVPAMKILHEIIYSFHMPLFFFISGFLTFKRDRQPKSRISLIAKRAKRLLIPYFFVGLAYAPVKLLLSEFANKPYDIHNLWQIFLGVNPDGELWFLYALFAISLIAIILNEKASKITLAITFVLALTIPVMPDITRHLFYFFLGMYMRAEFPKYFEQMKLQIVCLYGIIFVIINAAAIIIGNNPAFHVFTAVSGTFLCIRFSHWISSKVIAGTGILAALGLFSMDVYILSDIIKIPFRIIFWNKLHLYIGSFLICTLASIVLSYVISKYIIRKNKWLKKLVLGA